MHLTHPITAATNPTTPVPDPSSITFFPSQNSPTRGTAHVVITLWQSSAPAPLQWGRPGFSRNLARTRAASHTTQPTSPMYSCLMRTVFPQHSSSRVKEDINLGGGGVMKRISIRAHKNWPSTFRASLNDNTAFLLLRGFCWLLTYSPNTYAILYYLCKCVLL